MENTFTATELLTYANLQIAAETLYGKLKDPAGNPSDLTANGKAELTVKNLKDGNMHSSLFSETQAKEFVENWEIVSHLPNTSSGFSGTLFRVKAENGIPNTNLKNGDLVLSFRSTEFVEDYIHDNIATNTHEIADKGWAFGQISDMEQWFQSLKNAKLIGENQQITVTGYSLGGHLATAFHILHQDENLINNTFTFNGAGVGSMGGDEITTKEELQNAIKSFNEYRGGASDKFTGQFANGIDFNEFYNKVRTDLDTAYTQNASKDKIAGYLQAVKKVYLEVQDAITAMSYDTNIEKGLNDIETAIERILQIANEYQRISEMKLIDAKGEKQDFNKPVLGNIEALKNWQWF